MPAHCGIDSGEGPRRMSCPQCAKLDGSMAFECVECCIRWLSRMTREEIQINAPVIEKVCGSEHMEKVRKAWKGKRA